MNFLLSGGWSTRFKSLERKKSDEGWDSITAIILHRSTSVAEVEAAYPRRMAVGVGLGFYVSTVIAKPSQLPGVIAAQVELSGAFETKLKSTGAASAHSESPSGIRIPSLGTAVFEKTDILICEPTFEVMALDTIQPDTVSVGQQVRGAYGGTNFPQAPQNPFNFSAADVVANRTVHWPYGWCYIGVEWDRIESLYLKRYYYAYRHLVTA